MRKRRYTKAKISPPRIGIATETRSYAIGAEPLDPKSKYATEAERNKRLNRHNI